MCIVMSVIMMLMLFVGCSTTQESEQLQEQSEKGLSVNDAFNSQHMVTLNGGDYQTSDYNKTYTARNLGFGIILSETMLQLESQGRLAINEYEDWITISYISDEASQLIEDTDFDNLSEEETLKVFQSYSDKNYQVAGVYCHNQKDPVSKKAQDTFAETFSHVEELIALDNNAYYLGYNTDYSKMNLNQEEQKILDTLLEEIEDFKGGIAIFPVEEEEVFQGNMKEFSTTALDGSAVNQDVFKNYDLTMVNIWATWCGPCVSEMPELQKLYGQLPDNVNLITVCTDGKDDRETAQQIIDSVGAKFPVLLLDDKLQQSLMNSVQYFPTTIFVNKDGMPVGEAIFGVPGNDDVVEKYLSAIEDRLSVQGE